MLKKIEQHLLLPSPIQDISQYFAEPIGIEIHIKRDELIHPHVCGNKWRKLKYNLLEALNQGSNGLISYGGMYSNHLVAIAAAGSLLGIKTVGIVRSYKEDDENPTIQLLKGYRMKLIYVAPPEYKLKEESPIIQSIIETHSDCFLIPEGGTNELALKGVEEMIAEVRLQCELSTPTTFRFSHIITGLGTGGTCLGVLRAVLSSSSDTKVIAVSPFKGDTYDMSGISFITDKEKENLEIIPSAIKTRFGAYHKEIHDYILSFKKDTDIALDPIYTAKVMMTAEQLVKEDYFPKGSKVLVIHTGGLQGISGYEYQYKVDLSL